MKGWKKVVLAAIGLLGVVYILESCEQQVRYSLDSRTKIGIFESEISGVADEFMRRSPRLGGNWEEFRVCMKNGSCDPTSILSERDRIIRKEWPEIFDRVVVEIDWWGWIDIIDPDHYDEDQARFFSKFEEVGMDLRGEYVPKVVYNFDSETGRTTYDTKGFVPR